MYTRYEIEKMNNLDWPEPWLYDLVWGNDNKPYFVIDDDCGRKITLPAINLNDVIYELCGLALKDRDILSLIVFFSVARAEYIDEENALSDVLSECGWNSSIHDDGVIVFWRTTPKCKIKKSFTVEPTLEVGETLCESVGELIDNLIQEDFIIDDAAARWYLDSEGPNELEDYIEDARFILDELIKLRTSLTS